MTRSARSMAQGGSRQRSSWTRCPRDPKSVMTEDQPGARKSRCEYSGIIPLSRRDTTRAPSARQHGRVLQRRVLAAHGIGDRLRQALRTLPLGRRAGATVAADLVDPPIDLEAVAGGGAATAGDLGARAAAGP